MSPTRVLVLGANGMLGSAVVRRLLARPERWDLRSSVRGEEATILPPDRVVRLDASSDAPFELPEADYVVNCVGLIKQRPGLTREDLFAVNGRFVWRLQEWCDAHASRLVHITTDCVFSGRRGRYVESDPHDPTDDYGASKSAGEPPGALSLRTSIIGEELSRKLGLLEWVRTTSERPLRGFVNHLWNGLTTVALAEAIEKVLAEDLFTTGVCHVFSDVVSKYSLVRLIVETYRLEKEVVPFEAPEAVDRSLATQRALCGRLNVPPIAEQVARMAGRKASA